MDTCITWSGGADSWAAEAPTVSGWTVGAHLEHLLLSDTFIAEYLEHMAAGDADATSEGGPSFIGRVVLWTGRIPRGKARAPKRVLPSGLSRPDIEVGLRNIRARYEKLQNALPLLTASRAKRDHPILGPFTSRQWLRFVDIHHRHHGRIIQDILGA
jgi:hypothetical protein